MLTQTSAATAMASSTAALPVSVRKNLRSGVCKFRAHAVRPEKGCTPLERSFIGHGVPLFDRSAAGGCPAGSSAHCRAGLAGCERVPGLIGQRDGDQARLPGRPGARPGRQHEPPVVPRPLCLRRQDPAR